MPIVKNTFKHVWSVLCSKSIHDRDTNNLSIFDVFEQFNININVSNHGTLGGKINIPVQYEVTSLWVRENKDGDLKGEVQIEILSPGENTGKTFNHPIVLLSALKRIRTRIKITGLVITVAGDYLFKVKIKQPGAKEFKEVAEIPLEVNIIKQTAQSTVAKS